MFMFYKILYIGSPALLDDFHMRNRSYSIPFHLFWLKSCFGAPVRRFYRSGRAQGYPRVTDVYTLGWERWLSLQVFTSIDLWWVCLRSQLPKSGSFFSLVQASPTVKTESRWLLLLPPESEWVLGKAHLRPLQHCIGSIQIKEFIYRRRFGVYWEFILSQLV